MTKVSIISGFLGAGKTTFIKQLLTKVFNGEKVVLIENEFGEIGIDGGFLKDAGIEITEMNSGCICCTLVGDFSEALKKVLEQFHPDRILIEPSGVGKLSDVAAAVEDVESDEPLYLDRKITVVDAKKAKLYMKNFGEFFVNQVESADTIVLSRTDGMKEDKLEACVTLLREHNAKAPIITTPWDELEGGVIARAITQEEDLLKAAVHEHHHHHHDHDDEECCCHDHDHEHEHHHDHDHEEHEHHHHDHDHEHHHHGDDECCCHDHDHDHGHHHHHHADEVFTSWGAETVHKYDRAELEQLLEKLANTQEYGAVLRAKGIVALTDQSWIEFDLVPEEIEIRPSSPDYTGRLCVIGTDIAEDALKKAFSI